MCRKSLFLIVSVLCIGHHVESRTVYIDLNSPTDTEISFMTRYGYLEEHGPDVDMTYTAHSISEAVTKLQAFAGIPQTGILDAETKQLFTRRRCGVKDIENPPSRTRRFTASQAWNKKDLTYRIINGSSTLEKSRIEPLFKSALALWAPHGGLRFRPQDTGKADIMLSFVRGSHGDGTPFDGRGKVIAHAFEPPFGAIHFDDDEVWTDNIEESEDDEATDFFAVIVHEMGHALGLSHSNVIESVMYPYYQLPIEKLHEDDILGMQKLYFKPSEQPATEKITESPTLSYSSLLPRSTRPGPDDDDENKIPDLCFTNYDAIQVIQGKIYVFEEDWVWVLTEMRQIEAGSPRKFHEVFRGLPASVSTINAVYERRDGTIVIFSGRKFWQFDSSFNFIRRGSTSEYRLPRRVYELTTVFVSNYNNKTYLIEDERFWRYDEDTETMDRGYPKKMSAWRKLPYPIDSAIIWKGDTYFFRGPRFWRFDNNMIQAHKYYPLPTAQIWFPCDVTSEMERYVTNERD